MKCRWGGSKKRGVASIVGKGSVEGVYRLVMRKKAESGVDEGSVERGGME